MSRTQRTASGFRAGPDSQPVPSLPPSRGRPVSMSIARHGPNELIATIASAPAASACSAARTSSRPSGLSLTKTGTSRAAFAARIAAIIGPASSPM